MTANNRAFWDVVTASFHDALPPADEETVHQEASRDDLPDLDEPINEPRYVMLRDGVSELTKVFVYFAVGTAVVYTAAGLLYAFLIQ